MTSYLYATLLIVIGSGIGNLVEANLWLCLFFGLVLGVTVGEIVRATLI